MDTMTKRLDIRRIIMLQHDVETIRRCLLSPTQRSLIRFQHDRFINLNNAPTIENEDQNASFSDQDYFGATGATRFSTITQDMNLRTELDKKLLLGVLMRQEADEEGLTQKQKQAMDSTRIFPMIHK